MTASQATAKKVAIVTGGSRGLGLATIERLLQAGYRVATCSRKASAEIERLTDAHGPSGSFTWFCAEVGDEASEAAFFQAATDWAGSDGLYALVNNAAITGEGVLATFPNADSQRILEVNLLGCLRLARLTLRKLLQQRTAGRIVNVSSIVGLRGYTGLSAYAASKAGLDALTRTLTRENGRRGITVNSVAPGYLETELSATLRPHQRAQIVNRTPLGRLGTVDDIAPVIGFLLSEDAAFITGQTIVVDGGITN
jgi:3-oxoacyl-[acyl-carrier protein] reductase